MYYCDRCGTPLQPSDRFCPRCGAPIQTGVPGQPPRPKRRTLGIVLVMAAMVLLLLAAALYSQRDSLGELFEPAPGQFAGREEGEQVSLRPQSEAEALILEPSETLPGRRLSF